MTPRERVAAFFSRDSSLDPVLLARRVHEALMEDVGAGDIASDAFVPEPRPGRARIVAKSPGVVAGLDVARASFAHVDAALTVTASVAEGASVVCGDEVLDVSGDLHAILVAERTALNFLRRMSGIATTTRTVVEAVGDAGARVLDTRKTAPTLRMFDKQAVRMGGAWSHRDGLYDMCLVKENHIAAVGGLERALQVLVQLLDRGQLVEVEVSTVEDAVTVARGGVPLILLDNMSPDAMREVMNAMSQLAPDKRPALEASGNITLATAAAVAATGVDYLSMSALTDSPSLDLSLLVETQL